MSVAALELPAAPTGGVRSAPEAPARLRRRRAAGGAARAPASAPGSLPPCPARCPTRCRGHEREPPVRRRRVRPLHDAGDGRRPALVDVRGRDPAAGQAADRDPGAAGSASSARPPVAAPVHLGDRAAHADQAPLDGRGRGRPQGVDGRLAAAEDARLVRAQARRAPRHARPSRSPGPAPRAASTASGAGEVELDRGRPVLEDRPPAAGVEERRVHGQRCPRRSPAGPRAAGRCGRTIAAGFGMPALGFGVARRAAARRRRRAWARACVVITTSARSRSHSR